jgi:hypothetical protein
VYKCIDEASGNEYAIKFQRHVNGNRLNRFKKEIKLNKIIKTNEIAEWNCSVCKIDVCIFMKSYLHLI